VKTQLSACDPRTRPRGRRTLSCWREFAARCQISLYSSPMANPKTRKLSVVTVSMLIVVTTFGLANVIDNLVELDFLPFLPGSPSDSSTSCRWH
jgi:hypothetical protein